MKKLIIVFTVGLLVQQIIQAQGMLTYLSNIGQSSAGSQAVASDSWLATDFFTGNNISGYVLNSVQLGMTGAFGNPAGFTVMLYTFGGSLGGIQYPGNRLDTLNGSANPSTSGIYTYTDASSFMLLPSTEYSIVLTAGTTVTTGAYEWNIESASSSNFNLSDNWSVLISDAYQSSDGLSWTSIGGSYPNFTFPQYAITATPAPEPPSEILLCLGSLFLLWHRSKAKVVL